MTEKTEITPEEFIAKIKENIGSELFAPLITAERKYSKRQYVEGESRMKELAIEVILNDIDTSILEKMVAEPWLFQSYQLTRINEGLVGETGNGVALIPGENDENRLKRLGSSAAFVRMLTYAYCLKNVEVPAKKRAILGVHIPMDSKYHGDEMMCWPELECRVVKLASGAEEIEFLQGPDTDRFKDQSVKTSEYFVERFGNFQEAPIAAARFPDEFINAVVRAKEFLKAVYTFSLLEKECKGGITIGSKFYHQWTNAALVNGFKIEENTRSAVFSKWYSRRVAKGTSEGSLPTAAEIADKKPILAKRAKPAPATITPKKGGPVPRPL